MAGRRMTKWEAIGRMTTVACQIIFLLLVFWTFCLYVENEWAMGQWPW